MANEFEAMTAAQLVLHLQKQGRLLVVPDPLGGERGFTYRFSWMGDKRVTSEVSQWGVAEDELKILVKLACFHFEALALIAKAELADG